MRKLLQLLSTPLGATLTMLAMVVVPAALTLHTIRASAFQPAVAHSASRFGYTVSLLLFLVPSLLILLWLIPHQHLKLSRRALAITLALLFPLGALLDFFFAHTFFTFPNPEATLGILAPALHGGVPLEEYLFYFTGFLVVLCLYTWLDEYWLSVYSIPSTAARRIDFQRLLHFHPTSLILSVLAIAASLLVRCCILHLPLHFPDQFPGYFVFLVLTAGLPSTALLPAASPVINWRALSLTMFILLLTSLLWEVTLALPYGWWNFRDAQMIGIRITAWSFLPIEEVYVWVVVTYASVILYEIVKRWKASNLPARHAFLGRPSDHRDRPSPAPQDESSHPKRMRY